LEDWRVSLLAAGYGVYERERGRVKRTGVVLMEG
jgi:hypothetical protein